MSVKGAASFDRKHLVLFAIAHVLLGLGLAVVFENRVSVVSVNLAWVMIVVGLVYHIYSWTKR